MSLIQKVLLYLRGIFTRQNITILINKDEKIMASFFSTLATDLAQVNVSTPGQVGFTLSIGGLPVALSIPVKDANVQSAVQVAQALAPVVANGHITVESALMALVTLFHVAA